VSKFADHGVPRTRAPP